MGCFDFSVMVTGAIYTMNFLLIASSPSSIINFRGALIEALLNQGLTVHVAAPDLSVVSPLRKRLEDRGLIVHNTHFNRTGLNPLSDIMTIISLFRLMRRIRPEYVLSYTAKPVIYGSLAAQVSGVKQYFALITGLGFTFTEEFIDKRRLLYNFIRFLYKVGLRRARKIFFQNPDDEALFHKLGIVNRVTPTIVVNGSGVDLKYYYVTQLPSNINFLLITRLLESKGVRIYADAARKIRESYPDVLFTLVGKIDENPDSISQNELDKWINDGVINYLGYLSDVRKAISGCSVYVLPSYYREGTPRSILEAMSMGRAIITTDSPGCRETVINGDNGYLVKARSVENLVKALLHFIENPDCVNSMGSRSREIAEEKYDVHKVNSFMIREMGINHG